MKFYYVYILRSLRDERFYAGFSENLRRRIDDHNSGKNASTKYRRPLELVFYEAFLNKADAMKRERYFKTTKGKAVLKSMLIHFLQTKTKHNY